MREAWARTLLELAERDSRILLLTGDLGYMVLEPFAERFADRFINAGVAEQNMVGMASGMAEAGFLPFLYSIATFASLRAYEFVRNGPVLQGLPVRIAGVGGGFEYGPAGPSHYGLEDVGVMRLQPGLTVIAPADHEQARSALLATWDLPGPVYYRLGKDDRSTVAGLSGRFRVDQAEVVREGRDALLLVMGSIAGEAIAAAETLSARYGVEAGIAVVSVLHPLPRAALRELMKGYPLVVTVEAHCVHGGLGSAVCETVAEAGLTCRVARCGVEESAGGLTGSQAFLLRRFGLDAESLAERTLKELRKKV